MMKQRIVFLSTVLTLGALQCQAASRCYSATEKTVFVCGDNCSELFRCVRNGFGANDYAVYLVRTCTKEPGSYCNPHTGDCSADFCTDDGYILQDIQCMESGTFPHPWNCNASLACNDGGFPAPPTITYCTPGTSYDPKTKTCTSEATKLRPCRETPVRKCNSPGEVGGYPEDRSIFVVCTYNENGYLIPQFRSCMGKSVFDDNAKMCVDSSGCRGIGASFLVMAVAVFGSVMM